MLYEVITQSVNNAERYADYWIFGGIFRPVYLEAVPETFIDRVAINALADGSFSMEAFPVNIQKKQTIVAEITDSNVITSYSIHYTKLYDCLPRHSLFSHRRKMARMDVLCCRSFCTYQYMVERIKNHQSVHCKLPVVYAKLNSRQRYFALFPYLPGMDGNRQKNSPPLWRPQRTADL